MIAQSPNIYARHVAPGVKSLDYEPYSDPPPVLPTVRTVAIGCRKSRCKAGSDDISRWARSGNNEMGGTKTSKKRKDFKSK